MQMLMDYKLYYICKCYDCESDISDIRAEV